MSRLSFATKPSCLLLMLAAIGMAPGCSHDPNAAKDPASLTRAVPKPPAVPPARPETLNPEYIGRAKAQIKASSTSGDRFIRAHAIEACRQAMPEDGRPLILKGISDPDSLVVFSSLVAAGELKIREAYAPALDVYNTSTSKNVRLGAIFCLHRLGDTRFSHEFEKTAADPDRTVRANTAMLLGLLNEPTASRVLEYMARDTDPTIRLQAAEGLWHLHQNDALEALITATISRYADDQVIAAIALAGPRDNRVDGHLRGMLTTAYPEVNLAAARSLGQLGRDNGYGVAMQAVNSEEPRHRQLAAMALGAIGRSDAQTTLSKLLADKNEDVRIAAATGLLQLK
jgi:HEAT repeat protein